MTTFSPREIVSELDRFIIGQKDAKRAVAIALAQPLAPPAARRPDARRGDAEEHPDDRPDRRRQDRDLAPPGQARRRALHQGRGDQVHRGRLCRPRRRADHPRPRRDRHRPGAREDARGRQGARPSQRRGARARGAGRQDRQRRRRATASARSCATASSTTRRSRSRWPTPAPAACPASRSPACPAPTSACSTSTTCCQKAMGGKQTKTRKTTVKESYDAADQRRVRQAARPGRGGAPGAGIDRE